MCVCVWVSVFLCVCGVCVCVSVCKCVYACKCVCVSVCVHMRQRVNLCVWEWVRVCVHIFIVCVSTWWVDYLYMCLKYNFYDTYYYNFTHTHTHTHTPVSTQGTCLSLLDSMLVSEEDNDQIQKIIRVPSRPLLLYLEPGEGFSDNDSGIESRHLSRTTPFSSDNQVCM